MCCSPSVHLRSGWVCFFIRFGKMCHCSSEWVPSEWESTDALQWMGAIRMRVNGCSAVNGCRQNESQWMQMLTDGLECCDVFIRLSFWRHPFTAAHPLTLILMAPIHCRASVDSHSDGTHSLQSIHCWDISTNLMKKQPHLHYQSKVFEQ